VSAGAAGPAFDDLLALPAQVREHLERIERQQQAILLQLADIEAAGATDVDMVEFCRRVGISQATGWRWKRRGLFRCTEVGGRVRIPVAEIRRLRSNDDARVAELAAGVSRRRR
jgi:hypothetical protein